MNSVLRCAIYLALVGAVALLAAHPASAGDGSPFTPDERDQWYLHPVVRAAIPTMDRADWVQNPIDAFILARMEQAAVSPPPQADRLTLIRRATFDLHGLPPTPGEVEAFVADPRPNAFELLVERLLSSPRYGEKWARPWLDLVRFAESDGFKSDDPRESAWRYRDYVIRSLNADKPYDRFIAEQLAGDERFPGDPDALIATGFLRHWPYEYNQRNVRLQWDQILNDVTDVTAQVFLGLTVGCARCHDHKYDPILQADYYRLRAFFAPLAPRDDLVAASPDELAEFSRRKEEWESQTAEVRSQMDQIEAPHKDSLIAPEKSKFPGDIQAILDKPAAERTPLEEQLARLAGRQLVVKQDQMLGQMSAEERALWDELNASLTALDSIRPPPLAAVLAVSDVSNVAPNTHLPEESGGDPSDDIPPGFLSVIDAGDATIADRGAAAGGTGRRSALADWIADAANPLTARVMVNRIWQEHFGRGIVGTPSDFGSQGDPPTHPELLDWLAAEFVAEGWRPKHLHRLIVTSATYRQSGPTADFSFHPSLFTPFPLRRLTGEELHDALLSTSGELNLAAGGPSVWPELPPGFVSTYAWKPTEDPHQRHRRSIYLFAKRNLRFPLFDAFDAPNAHESCSRRSQTITAPQALLMINGDWSLDRAKAFAARLLADGGPTDAERIAAAWRLAYGRPPTAEESAAATAFVGGQNDPNANGQAAWIDLCHVLLNSNEFLYVD